MFCPTRRIDPNENFKSRVLFEPLWLILLEVYYCDQYFTIVCSVVFDIRLYYK